MKIFLKMFWYCYHFVEDDAMPSFLHTVRIYVAGISSGHIFWLVDTKHCWYMHAYLTKSEMNFSNIPKLQSWSDF